MPLDFRTSFEIILKKGKFEFGGSTRTIVFNKQTGASDATQLVPKGKTLYVTVGPGLSNNTSKQLKWHLFLNLFVCKLFALPILSFQKFLSLTDVTL